MITTTAQNGRTLAELNDARRGTRRMRPTEVVSEADPLPGLAVITGRSRSVSVVDHQTGSTSWIARGQVDALSTDIAGAARISRVSQHAITGRHPRNTDRDSRCRRRSKTSSTPVVGRDGETPRRGPVQPEQARSTTSVQDRGRWPVPTVSEAIHGYDERVDVECVCRITKSIALFVAEWCGVAEAR
jgi:hypothetical protein